MAVPITFKADMLFGQCPIIVFEPGSRVEMLTENKWKEWKNQMKIWK